MNTKTIIFKTGEEQLTFEQTRERVLPLARKYVHRYNNSLNQEVEAFNDIMQHVEIELWKGYENYDASLGFCFTTYIVTKIKKGIRDAVHKNFAAKRTGSVVSSNEAMFEDGDVTLEDLLTNGDSIEENYVFQDVMSALKTSLTQEESDCLIHIIDPKALPATELAERYSISRQAANKRVRKVKEKVKSILGGYYNEN